MAMATSCAESISLSPEYLSDPRKQCIASERRLSTSTRIAAASPPPRSATPAPLPATARAAAAPPGQLLPFGDLLLLFSLLLLLRALAVARCAPLKLVDPRLRRCQLQLSFVFSLTLSESVPLAASN
eukprot:6895978-Prymnesium_polylepis.3